MFFSTYFSLTLAFLVSATVTFLLVSHFQHTLLRAWFGGSGMRSSQASQAETVNTAPVLVPDTIDQLGCGCPLCCAAVNL